MAWLRSYFSNMLLCCYLRSRLQRICNVGSILILLQSLEVFHFLSNCHMYAVRRSDHKCPSPKYSKASVQSLRYAPCNAASKRKKERKNSDKSTEIQSTTALHQDFGPAPFHIIQPKNSEHICNLHTLDLQLFTHLWLPPLSLKISELIKPEDH